MPVPLQACWAAFEEKQKQGRSDKWICWQQWQRSSSKPGHGIPEKGLLNRTLLWLIGDRVTPWTSDLYLSLESDSEGQWDEMLKGWNAIPTSLAPSPLYGCCRDLQVLLLWLLFMFSASSANHGFINLLQNQLFCTTWCFLPLSVWKSNFSAASLVQALEASICCPAPSTLAYFDLNKFLMEGNVFLSGYWLLLICPVACSFFRVVIASIKEKKGRKEGWWKSRFTVFSALLVDIAGQWKKTTCSINLRVDSCYLFWKNIWSFLLALVLTLRCGL